MVTGNFAELHRLGTMQQINVCEGRRVWLLRGDWSRLKYASASVCQFPPACRRRAAQKLCSVEGKMGSGGSFLTSSCHKKPHFFLANVPQKNALVVLKALQRAVITSPVLWTNTARLFPSCFCFSLQSAPLWCHNGSWCCSFPRSF